MTKAEVEAAIDSRDPIIWASHEGPRKVRVLAIVVGERASVVTLDGYGKRLAVKFKYLAAESPE